MTIALASFLFTIWLTASGTAGLSPDTLYEMNLRGDRAPHCQPKSDDQRWADGSYPQGKAATFNMNGEFNCHREIFDKGERDSFANFVARHTSDRVRGAVLKISNEHRDKKIWMVDVDDSDRALSRYIATAIRSELAAALGPGRVGRAAISSSAISVDALVSVRINRVTDPEKLIDLFVVYEDKEGKRRWREY